VIVAPGLGDNRSPGDPWLAAAVLSGESDAVRNLGHTLDGK